MKTIDLNCDMGESYGRYKLGLDDEVIKHVSSANIACGWHAGDPTVMDHTVRLAAAHGVAIGAHPGYPDLLGFGRRRMDCTPDELRSYVIYQIGALSAFCAANGVRLRHVKAHGSLYLTALEDQAVATAIAEAVAAVDSNLICFAIAGPKGDLMTRACRAAGIRIVYEAFADRSYTPDGNLVPRRSPYAVISDPALVAARALMVAKEGKMVAVDGSVIDLAAATLCVHGDNQKALELVIGIRQTLGAEGIEVKARE